LRDRLCLAPLLELADLAVTVQQQPAGLATACLTDLPEDPSSLPKDGREVGFSLPATPAMKQDSARWFLPLNGAQEHPLDAKQHPQVGRRLLGFVKEHRLVGEVAQR